VTALGHAALALALTLLAGLACGQWWAGATNGPTRDTTITVTVLAEGANPW